MSTPTSLFPYSTPSLHASIEGGFLIVEIRPQKSLYSVWLGEGFNVEKAALNNLNRIARENGLDVAV